MTRKGEKKVAKSAGASQYAVCFPDIWEELCRRVSGAATALANMRGVATDLKVLQTQIMPRLGMEDEEIERLLDTRGMVERGRAAGFNNGFTVKNHG
jgi:hypothetical protein